MLVEEGDLSQMEFYSQWRAQVACTLVVFCLEVGSALQTLCWAHVRARFFTRKIENVYAE